MLSRIKTLMKQAGSRSPALSVKPRSRRQEFGNSPLDWRIMVDAMPDAAVVLDAAAQTLHKNAGFGELYPDVRIGEPLSRWIRHPDVIHAIDTAQSEDVMQMVAVTERLPVERRISVRVIRIGVPDFEVLGRPALLVTFRDLTEQDKLAQMREDFIANASHELRTPLASLKGFIETLQGPARDDATARERFLAVMAGQAERMTRLIDDLLSLSRVEMRAHLQPRGIVDLNEVGAYVLQTMQPMAESAGSEIVLVKSEAPARIRGERDEIVQVVSNLVHNALTYGGENGKVHVTVARSQVADAQRAHVRLAVRDEGAGIAPEHLPRLTERFYRANVASSRSKGGTGLGLAIVKHIVARHRGELEISSVVGSGSTFAVTFDALT